MKKKIILFLAVILVLLTGCSNGKKNNDFIKEFMPAFEKSGLDLKAEFVSEKELHLIGANVDSFEECVEVLKEIGYQFLSISNSSEESMINMQLWVGKNENYRVDMYLMLDLKDSTGASDYLRINYSPN